SCAAGTACRPSSGVRLRAALRAAPGRILFRRKRRRPAAFAAPAVRAPPRRSARPQGSQGSRAGALARLTVRPRGIVDVDVLEEVARERMAAIADEPGLCQ